MEAEITKFLLASGDTGVLFVAALFGYNKLISGYNLLSTRLTVIETILNEKRGQDST